MKLKTETETETEKKSFSGPSALVYEIFVDPQAAWSMVRVGTERDIKRHRYINTPFQVTASFWNFLKFS